MSNEKKCCCKFLNTVLLLLNTLLLIVVLLKLGCPSSDPKVCHLKKSSESKMCPYTGQGMTHPPMEMPKQ